MRVVDQKRDDKNPLFEEVGIGEVFTYITKLGTAYILMCSH